MEPQVWVAGRHPRKQVPRQDRLAPPRNRPGFGLKPLGGLWTSTHSDPENWPAWCRCEGQPGFLHRRRLWLLKPDPNAKVYTIDAFEDLCQLWSRYPLTGDPILTMLNDDSRTTLRNLPRRFRYERRWVDWLKVAQDFDAVHLTARGQWATRFPDVQGDDMGLDLYGWDCESSWWARWKFVEVRSLGKAKMPTPAIREYRRNHRNFIAAIAYQRETGKIAYRARGQMIELGMLGADEPLTIRATTPASAL